MQSRVSATLGEDFDGSTGCRLHRVFDGQDWGTIPRFFLSSLSDEIQLEEQFQVFVLTCPNLIVPILES